MVTFVSPPPTLGGLGGADLADFAGLNPGAGDVTKLVTVLAADDYGFVTRAAVVDPIVAAHEAAGDPHPVYLTQPEGDALYQPLGGAAAPVGAQYVVLAADGTLTDERVLTRGDGVEVRDLGAGNAVEVRRSRRRHFEAGHRGGTTSYFNPAGFGSVTRGTALDALRTDYQYVQYTSALGDGNSALFGGGTFDLFRVGYEPRIWFRVRTPAAAVLTNVVFSAGFVSSEAHTPVNKVVIEYRTSRADSGFKLVTRDGAVENVVDLGVAIAADTEYEGEVWVEAGVAKARINASAVASNAVNLPLAATTMGWQVGLYTTEAVAKVLLINAILGETK